jgi:hypothetical protein
MELQPSVQQLKTRSQQQFYNFTNFTMATKKYIYSICYIKILKIFTTHFILYIFGTIYSFKIKSQINKTLIIRAQHSYKKLTTNENISCINYKEQYECEWNPIILTNYIICIIILNFFIYLA